MSYKRLRRTRGYPVTVAAGSGRAGTPYGRRNAVGGAVGCLRALARHGYRHARRHRRPARRHVRHRLLRAGRRPQARGAAAPRRRPGPRRGRDEARRRDGRGRGRRPRPLHRSAGRPGHRRHLRLRPLRAGPRPVHPGRPRVRRRPGGPGRAVRRGDGRAPQGGLLGAVRGRPHPYGRTRRRPARRHRRGAGRAPRGRRGRGALPGRLPGRARPRARRRRGARRARRRTPRRRAGVPGAPAAVSAQARRAGPEELQGGHPQ